MGDGGLWKLTLLENAICIIWHGSFVHKKEKKILFYFENIGPYRHLKF